MRQTKIPNELRPHFERFCGNVIDSVEALREMMDHLDDVLESTFARIDSEEVIAIGHHVHEHEYKADTANKELTKEIYQLEDKMSPLAIVHLMRFTDVLDGVADSAENAANKIVLIVSK
jgi:predicted phosphate transport protein (TIGR00153 family)